MIALSLTACSARLRSEILRPEPDNKNWLLVKSNGSIYYKFESENVSIVVYGITLTQGIAGPAYQVSWGPPFLPILPDPWPWPKFYDFVFYIKMENRGSSATIDFSKIRIQFLDEKSIQPSAAYIWEDEGPLIFIKIGKIEYGYHGKLLDLGETTLLNQKVLYILKFDRLPSDVEEIILDLGNIYVNSKYVRLPPIKYRKLSEYHYVPLHFGLQ